MTFKLWSELNPKAQKELKPDFGFRNWDYLSENEKYKIWKYLEFYFFDKDPIKDFNNSLSDSGGYYYKFFEDDEGTKRERIILSVAALNNKFKAKSYAKNFLENGDFNSACKDFYEIFVNEKENAVIELLSLYCKSLIYKRASKKISAIENEAEDGYQLRLEKWRWEEFDKFSENLNGVFTDFGINLYLTRQGFILRQDKKIIEEIYEPVLGYLSHSKWKEANRLLSDSFNEYRKNTPQGYSNCVTNVISAIQAFLQIMVNGKIGKGDISKLILEAQKKKLIPIDYFSKKFFKDIESFFAQERQKTGIAHPKKEYSTEKNARLVLNLAMIFFQHCIQS